MSGVVEGMMAGAAKSAMEGAIGSIFTTKAQRNNYLLNERAAQNADWRARQQYEDMYSISAQMRELKKAGLSPSLMYGNVPSVQGATGAQGSGASGISPAFGTINPTELAQAELMQAEARKANAEADTMEGKNDRGSLELSEMRERINNIIQNTNNAWLQGENIAIHNELDAIDVMLRSKYGDREMSLKCDKLEAEISNTRALLRSLLAKGKIDEESANSIIEYYRERVVAQQAQIMLNRAQTQLAHANVNLTLEQAKKVINDILIDNQNIELTRRGVNIKRDALEAQIAQWCQENGLRERGQDIEIAKTIVDYIETNQRDFISLIDAVIPF